MLPTTIVYAKHVIQIELFLFHTSCIALTSHIQFNNTNACTFHLLLLLLLTFFGSTQNVGLKSKHFVIKRAHFFFFYLIIFKILTKLIARIKTRNLALTYVIYKRGTNVFGQTLLFLNSSNN